MSVKIVILPYYQQDNPLTVEMLTQRICKHTLCHTNCYIHNEKKIENICKYLQLILFNIILQYKPFYCLNHAQLYQVKEKHSLNNYSIILLKY